MGRTCDSAKASSPHTTAATFFLQTRRNSNLRRPKFNIWDMSSGKGVEMDNEKMVVVYQWPIPSTVKALRGFLGLTGYYQCFIRDYGKTARPLTDLLKKGNFEWTPTST